MDLVTSPEKKHDPHLASTQFWIQSLFKNFYWGERIKKICGFVCQIHQIRCLHNRRFMSQARWTQHFARGARPGEKKSFIFLMPSSYASRKIPRSPRLAHKAPFIQATGYVWTEAVSGKKKLRIQKYPDTCGRGLRHSCDISRLSLIMGIWRHYYFKTLYLKPEGISTTICFWLFFKLKTLKQKYFSPSLLFSITQRFIFQWSKANPRIRSFYKMYFYNKFC